MVKEQSKCCQVVLCDKFYTTRAYSQKRVVVPQSGRNLLAFRSRIGTCFWTGVPLFTFLNGNFALGVFRAGKTPSVLKSQASSVRFATPSPNTKCILLAHTQERRAQDPFLENSLSSANQITQLNLFSESPPCISFVAVVVISMCSGPSRDSNITFLFASHFSLPQFNSSSFFYTSSVFASVDSMSITAVPAPLATVQLSIANNFTNLSERVMDIENGGIFRFGLPKNGISVLTLTSEAQSGDQSRYIIEITRRLPNTCAEQRLCETELVSAGNEPQFPCGRLCPVPKAVTVQREIYSIAWEVPLGLALVYATLCVLFIALMRRGTVGFPWISTPTIIFFSAVFDLSNDIVFVILLFNREQTDLAVLCTGLLGVTIVSNMLTFAYVIRREIQQHKAFHTWFTSHYGVTAVVAVFGIGNTETMTLLNVGSSCRNKIKLAKRKRLLIVGSTRTLQGIQSVRAFRMRAYFSAPLSDSFVRSLQHASWLSLLLDDVGFFGVQMVHIACLCWLAPVVTVMACTRLPQGNGFAERSSFPIFSKTGDFASSNGALLRACLYKTSFISIQRILLRLWTTLRYVNVVLSDWLELVSHDFVRVFKDVRYH